MRKLSVPFLFLLIIFGLGYYTARNYSNVQIINEKYQAALAQNKKTQDQLEKMLTQTLQEGENLAPITFAELLGAEGVQQLRQNYMKFDRVIATQYKNVDKAIETAQMQNVRIIPKFNVMFR